MKYFPYGSNAFDAEPEIKLNPAKRAAICLSVAAVLIIIVTLFVGVSKPRTESGYQFKRNI